MYLRLLVETHSDDQHLLRKFPEEFNYNRIPLVIEGFTKMDYNFLFLYTKKLKLSMCFSAGLQLMQVITECCIGNTL